MTRPLLTLLAALLALRRSNSDHSSISEELSREEAPSQMCLARPARPVSALLVAASPEGLA